LSAERPPVVLIGPGGVGKGTVARAIAERDPGIWLSRSWTTRPRRGSEGGSEYVFVDREQFQRAIAEGRFYEWAEFQGHLYGSPLPEPGSGQRVLLEIEVQGAAQVLAREPRSLVILLRPPSLEALRARLEARGDDASHIEARLASSARELEVGEQLATAVVVNDDLESAIAQVLSILNEPD
jgi:guanylate kinase